MILLRYQQLDELCPRTARHPSEATVGILVPTSVAANALGVTPDAIRLLRHRGKLTRHGTKQRALVDIDELIDLRGASAMPTRAPRRCTRSGCQGGAACRNHGRKRPSSTALGYDRQWRGNSADFLREHPWCQVHGCRRRSKHTDHIDGDNTNNQPGNWQALCVQHHSQKTALHDGGFGRPRTPRPGHPAAPQKNNEID